MDEKNRNMSAYTSRHLRRLLQRQTEMEISNLDHPEDQNSSDNSDQEHRSQPNDNDRIEEGRGSIVPNPPDNIADPVDYCDTHESNSNCGDSSDSASNPSTEPANYLSDWDMSECADDQELNTESIEIIEDRENHTDLENDLRSWALHFNIPHKALSALLVILINYVTNYRLPKDARTLLKTPRQTNLQPCSNGVYWHCGLDKALSSIAGIYTEARLGERTIKLLLNVDGLPLFKSTSSCLWPILVSDSVFKCVFMVGAFYGEDKPKKACEYLQAFVTELTSVIHSGFVFMGRTFKIELHAIVCDAPAKSFILNTKNHNGYFSCTKCTIEGSYIKHRMCFPYSEIQSPLRTDHHFANNIYEDYQRGASILQTVPNLKLVSDVPIDCMHLIYLGVVKKILLLLIRGPLAVRLPANLVEKMSQVLESLRNSVPNDFARLPRSFKYLKDWKATEFRQFLLYTGPIVLSCLSNIKPDVYKNFMTLHVAISLLSSPALIKNSANINYANQLLRQFVKSFGEIYGVEYMSHNIHNLLHICADVEKYGTLDSYSAFRFENYLSSVKRKVRSSLLPLQQIAKRYAEIQANELQDLSPIQNEIRLQNMHPSGPVADLIETSIIGQYKCLQTQYYSIKCDDEKNNSCLLTNGQVLNAINIVKCIDDKVYVIGNLCTASGNIYTIPCPSQTINISKIRKSRDICVLPVTAVKGKVWQVEVNRDLLAFPLRHTLTAE